MSTDSACLESLHQHIQRLRDEIVEVVEALSLRTARATMATVSHAQVIDQLVGQARNKLKDLEEMNENYLNQSDDLIQYVKSIEQLAQQTSQVKAILLRLETQVAKLTSASK